MPVRKEQTEIIYRDFVFKQDAIDEKARTVELAFSSEEPVERWGYNEILDHSQKSVRLGRLTDGGAILVDHNRSDHVGVVESVSIDNDRVGRAVVRFGKSQRADEIFQDVVDGIRTKVSVGYWIYEGTETRGEGDVPTTFRATDWEPMEISIVSIPADANVGVGRSAHQTKPEDREMPDKIKEKPAPTEAETIAAEKRAVEDNKTATREANERDVLAAKTQEDAIQNERTRVDGILSRAQETKQHDLAKRFINDGRSLADFDDVCKIIADQSKQTASEGRMDIHIPRRRSKMKAFENTRDGEESAFRAGMWAQAVVYGSEDARKWCNDNGVRVMTGLTSGTSSVVPDEMILPIIDLREQYGIARQHCHVHPMSSDTATVPRRKTGVTAYFVGREDATTESDAAFEDIDLVAREVAALTRVSRSYAADAAINLGDHIASEMAYAFAVKEDDCLFNGDGGSSYGKIYGIRPKIIDGNHTAGAIDAASGNDTFAEITNTDLVNVASALPEFPGIQEKWYASKRGKALMFDRLMAAAGGNTKRDLAQAREQQWLGDEIIISQSMPKSTGDLSNVAMAVYGDLNLGVTFGDRQGFEVEILRERYAEYRQIGIQAVERFDIVVHGLGDNTDAGPIVALIGE